MIRSRFVLVLAALLTLAGGVLAVAASRDQAPDPAPPPATRDVPGIVSLARPVEPVELGRTPPWAIEMRTRRPDGTTTAVAVFEQTRRRRGRTVRETCSIAGEEAELRRTRRPFGNCYAEEPAEPWSITTGASSRGPVVIAGIVSKRVERLTVAGPGGTFAVPRSRLGAFEIVYGRRATGRAVLSARLDDGTTRFFRTDVPPTQRPAGAAVAADPGGLPPWYVTAYSVPDGRRRGQTIVVAAQDSAIRRAGTRGGGARLPPVAGDLRRAPVVATTIELGPGRPPGQDGLSRFAPRRTILVGAVAPAVRSVEVVTAAGPRRPLALSDAGRAFIAVFPAGVRPRALSLAVTLRDGSIRRFSGLTGVGGAEVVRPVPRTVGRIEARVGPRGSRRLELRATLSGPATSVEVRFRGRRVRLRRLRSTAYAGRYTAPRGDPPLRKGRVERSDTVICALEGCARTVQRVRLR